MANIAEKKTLLLVEDNTVNLKILIKILKDSYNLLTAENGQVALDILNGTEYNTISAVILDLVMPVMDGYEVIRRMRADKRFQQMPIIVASGDDKEAYALSLGANDYVAKPYKPEIIKHRIANVIYLRETSAFVNMVQYDLLTGLYSKEYFYHLVDELLKKHPKKKYDIICCNIEQFKLINDLYGISVGDDILKHCADVIRNMIGNNGLYSRLESDIFAACVEHSDSYSNQYFEKINERFNEMDFDTNMVVRYGICEATGPSVAANRLCDRARFAILSIKGKYGAYYKIYDNKIRQHLIDEQFILANMKKAIDENQFEVYFQPKYDLKTERIVGAEALIRWNSPEKGFMSPGDFIPLFEKNGFITELDTFVWRTCCKQIRKWLDEGKKAVPISVNVSRADIYNPNIDNILISLIREYNLTPKYIYLEITESAYTENPAQLVETVKKLKNLGFIIEMDDFGSGYSSLNMLSELPIDVLKLDMGFLQNHEQENKRNILSFIISLAKWLHLGTIAEGVETIEHLSFLRSLNCECAQGYYFAKPMEVKKFEKLMLEQNQYVPAPELKTTFNRSEMQAYHPETIVYIGEHSEDEIYFRNLFSDYYMVIRCIDADSLIKNDSGITSDITAILYAIDGENSVKTLSDIAKCCDMFSVPVISVHSSLDTVGAAVEAGVTDYIIKPFFDSPAKQRIEALISNSQILKIRKDNKLQFAIEEMKKRAEHDSLTGLLNRAEFKNRVKLTIENITVKSGIFMMLDVDNFKYINDTYGHYIGDDVLHAIGHTIYNLFGKTDIMGRMGGDEFAIFVPNNTDEEHIMEHIDTLCNKINFSIETVPVSCSVGVSKFPKDGETFNALYENADIALLYAKRSGKSQCKIYEHSLMSDFDEQLENRAAQMLDEASEAMFVCDAVTSDIIYINDTACKVVNQSKKLCLGEKCYSLFWERCTNCDRCTSIDKYDKGFYHEDTVLNDGKTKIHIKARTDNWDGRKVKVHYLQLL